MPDGLPFSPFEVQDDSNPSGNGLSHLNRAKSGGAATIHCLEVSNLERDILGPKILP